MNGGLPGWLVVAAMRWASPTEAPQAAELEPAPAEASHTGEAAREDMGDAAPSIDATRLRAAIAAIEDRGPSLAELQRGALARAGVLGFGSSSWRRRARVAAALPTLTVQYDQRLDRGWTLDQEAGTADALRSDGQHQSVIRVKASWELDRLVFSPDELRVARAAIDVDDWRTRVLVEITALHFERQRLLLALELEPGTDLASTADALVRVGEIEGLLAGLCGVEFP